MDREAAVDSIVRALRKVNVQGSLFGQTVAIRLGLSDSDVAALQMLIDGGAATAGRLSELTGLTTGAVTHVIDRLEQSGYVRRVQDPADRRCVVVEVVPEKLVAMQSMLGAIARAGSAEVARYSDAQLELIGDFLSRMADVTRTEAAKLREEPAANASPETGPAEHAAPLGGLAEARLVVRSGASALTLRSDRTLGDLYRAKFEGAIPKMRVRDGVVSIQYRGFFDWRQRRADVTLNATIPWSVEVQGGATKFTADLRGIDLRRFEVNGGAWKLELSLGQPRGAIPIRLVGGASSIRVDRPAAVGVRVTVTGGMGKVEIDGQSLGPRGGTAIVETAGASARDDRFEVEIVGGASKVTVAARPER